MFLLSVNSTSLSREYEATGQFWEPHELVISVKSKDNLGDFAL